MKNQNQETSGAARVGTRDEELGGLIRRPPNCGSNHPNSILGIASVDETLNDLFPAFQNFDQPEKHHFRLILHDYVFGNESLMLEVLEKTNVITVDYLETLSITIKEQKLNTITDLEIYFNTRSSQLIHSLTKSNMSALNHICDHHSWIKNVISHCTENSLDRATENHQTQNNTDHESEHDHHSEEGEHQLQHA